MKNAVRSAFFLVPLVCAALLVLLCAFLIPCQKGELDKRPQWERALGDAGGVTPPALALWDVDGDSVEDVFLGVTEWTNDNHPTQGNKIYSAVALSALSGQVLWRKVMRESVMYIQCGLQFSTQPSPVVLLIGKSILTAVNGTTGKTLWSVLLKNIESQAVLLPDLQGDSVPDLLIATLPADEALDLSLTLISGLTGAKLGHPVPFNLTAQGKLIGPLLKYFFTRHSQPASGHFNGDGILDLCVCFKCAGFLLQVQVVDGANGQRLWSEEFVCPRLVLETSAISTSTGQSAFLFWASDPIKGQKNVTKTTVAPGVAAAEPLIRKLFLLHPTHPTILLELTSTTDTAVTSAVSYQERQKDASYITVSSRPTPDSEPGARIVKSMSLRAAIAKGKIVRLHDSSRSEGPAKPSVMEINKFFRRLSFKHQ